MTQQSSKWARPSPTIRVGVLGLLAAILLVLPLALAPRAEAYIYWTTRALMQRPRSGARTSTAPVSTQGFIKRLGRSPTSLSTTRTSTGRRGADPGVGADTIGRAKLDGTGVVLRLFRAPGCFAGVVRPALWRWTRTTSTGRPIGDSAVGIGRAKLDGTGVDADFINLAVASHRVPSLSTATTSTGRTRGPIGRAKLDGTAVDESFISGRRCTPSDVAVDRDHIYWTGSPGGDRPRQDRRHRGRLAFITPRGDPGRRRSRRQARLLDRIRQPRHRTISRAKLDGTDVQRAFIDRIRNRGLPSRSMASGLRERRPRSRLSARRARRSSSR